MNMYKSLVMKAEGFSCPYLYRAVSIRSLTKCVNFPAAQEIKEALPLVRGGTALFSTSSMGSALFQH